MGTRASAGVLPTVYPLQQRARASVISTERADGGELRYDSGLPAG